MNHKDVDALIAQLESLLPCDIDAEHEYRIQRLVNRRKTLARQADALYHDFLREVATHGFLPAANSWQNEVFVEVIAEEIIARKLDGFDDLVEYPAYKIVAQYIDHHGARGWQVTKTEYGFVPLAE